MNRASNMSFGINSVKFFQNLSVYTTILMINADTGYVVFGEFCDGKQQGNNYQKSKCKVFKCFVKNVHELSFKVLN